LIVRLKKTMGISCKTRIQKCTRAFSESVNGKMTCASVIKNNSIVLKFKTTRKDVAMPHAVQIKRVQLGRLLSTRKMGNQSLYFSASSAKLCGRSCTNASSVCKFILQKIWDRIGWRAVAVGVLLTNTV